MTPKQRAAEAALEHVKSGMVVGLGTGSTAEFFLQALGRAIKEGKLKNITGVPTSRKSESRSQELGIPLTDLVRSPLCDVTVDGADEVAPDLNLIKGLGGALLREKMVAQNSKKMIVIADASKRVQTLGTHSPLPVEVIQFCHAAQEPFFKKLGATPTLRMTPENKPFVTDNGNHIYDLKFSKIDNPVQLEHTLLHRAGIVDTGLFLHVAQTAIIATDSDIEILTRP